MSNDKIVIHKFSPKSKNETYAPGLADFFKGSIALHQYSTIYNFKLYLDFSEHPLQNFLEKNEYPPDVSPNSETIELFNTTPPFLRTKLEAALQESGIVKIQCNLDYEQAPSSETIEFVLKNFRPLPSVSDRIISLKKELGLIGEYTTIHIRAGDTFMIHNSNSEHDHRFKTFFGANNTQNLIKLLDFFREYCSDDVFLISDNAIVKQFVAKKYNFKTTPFIPMHSGALGKDDDTLQRSEELLIEFFVMVGATNVRCYSWMGHSGFSDMAKILYSLPLETHWI